MGASVSTKAARSRWTRRATCGWRARRSRTTCRRLPAAVSFRPVTEGSATASSPDSPRAGLSATCRTSAAVARTLSKRSRRPGIGPWSLAVLGRPRVPDHPGHGGQGDVGLGDLDAFVVVVDPSISPSSGLVYGSYFGGTVAGTSPCPSNGRGGSCDYGLGVAVDGSGRILLAGQTFSDSTSAPFPVTAGALQSTRRDAPDAFVARFAIDGTVDTHLYFGGDGEDSAKVAVGSGDSIYLTGFTSSTDSTPFRERRLPNRRSQAGLTALSRSWRRAQRLAQ